jgi:hypothetical protein
MNHVTNVGKTTKNPKFGIGHNSTQCVPKKKKLTAKQIRELNLKQGTKAFNENLEDFGSYSDSVVKSEAKQEGLIEQFFNRGFKSIYLVSPRDKKVGQGANQKVIKSKNTFLTQIQFDKLLAEMVKYFPQDVQEALKLPKDARSEYQSFLYQKWSKKPNQMVSTISRGLKTKEDRAEAIAENERRIAKGLKPKGKVSKKPSRNRTPDQVFNDNILQCIKIIQEHEGTLKIAQPNDLIAHLRKAITLKDNKSF